MKKFLCLLVSLWLATSLAGCLRTRSQLSAEEKMKETHHKQEREQQKKLEKTVQEDRDRQIWEQRESRLNLRFQDLETQARHMQGRLESVEVATKQSADTQVQSQNQHSNNNQEIWARIKFLEQAVENLATEMTKKNVPSKGSLELAKEHFKNKRWKEAALEFGKYRTKNPQGKHYVLATYKIGLCFEEMGNKVNARLFYKEVIDNHPKDPEAQKARARLKKLNKGNNV